MPAIETPKDIKQTVDDLEAAIVSLLEAFREATGKDIALLNTWVGADGKRRVRATMECDL